MSAVVFFALAFGWVTVVGLVSNRPTRRSAFDVHTDQAIEVTR